MVRFVEKHWAAKDYTHIGYTGGKYVADRLVDALITGVDSMRREIELRERIDRLLKYDSAAIDFRFPTRLCPCSLPFDKKPDARPTFCRSRACCRNGTGPDRFARFVRIEKMRRKRNSA